MDVEQRASAAVTRLRANSVGQIGLATLGAVMMSPALGIYGNWGGFGASGPVGGFDGDDGRPAGPPQT
jgi:hypothetical protein